MHEALLVDLHHASFNNLFLSKHALDASPIDRVLRFYGRFLGYISHSQMDRQAFSDVQ
jgi:hypothetical protein